jgi:hypothetical protein
MSGLEAWPVFVRLQKVFGPMLGRTFGDADTGLDEGAAARSLATLAEQLTVKDLEDVILPLLSKVTCDGVPVGGTDSRGREAFALRFGGRFGLMFEVLGVCLEVNFLDFFDVARRAFVGMAQTLLALMLQTRPVIRPSESGQMPGS